MILTREWIKAQSTSPLTDAFTCEQIELMGETNVKGWLSRLRGKEIPDDVAREVAYIGLKGRNRKRYTSLTDNQPSLNLEPQ